MPYEKFAIITLTFKWHTGEKSLETFGKQIENCLHQNTTYCYFQKQRKCTEYTKEVVGTYSCGLKLFSKVKILIFFPFSVK